MIRRGSGRVQVARAVGWLPVAIGLLFAAGWQKSHRRQSIESRTVTIQPIDVRAALAAMIVADDFDVQTINTHRRADGSIEFSVHIFDTQQTVLVRPHSVRAAGFQFTASARDGRQRIHPPGSTTYRGTVHGVPGSVAALSIRDSQITGMIDDGFTRLWIQPASQFMDDAPARSHMLVDQVDWLPIEGECGLDSLDHANDSLHARAASPLAGAGSCLSETEIAIDCDYEFWELEGFSEETLISDIESVINAMDAIYQQDTGITYRITHLNYWTDQLGDPYVATNHSQMLGEFRTWWNANEGGVHRDVAHLMTGKNIDGSVIGVAYLSVICDSTDGYGLSQSLYTNEFGRRVALTSHELGHNWSACHCNQGGCTGGGVDADCGIMCSSISGCTQTHDMFSQRSIDAITSWRDSVGCLAAADTVSVALTQMPVVTPTTDDDVGQSVAVSGGWAVVGAPRDDELAGDAGAAYVFQQQAGAWVQMQKLTAPDAAAGDAFGFSIDIDGDYLVVGAPLRTKPAGALAALGAAYVFRKTNDVWAFHELLVPTDPAANDQFGTSVAVSGQRVAVGSYLDDDNGNASGSAYVWTTNNANWFFENKLVPGDGAPNDQFGIAVDLDGDDVVVGAWRADAPGFDSGAAYIFHHDGVSWNEVDKLLSPDGDIVDQFGRAVAIQNGVALIGAPGDDEAGAGWGAAYSYSRNGSNWNFDDKLMPSLVSDFGQFGYAVTLDNEFALIGAWRDDLTLDDAGSAFLFKRQFGWLEQEKLTAPIIENLERFGASVGLHGGAAVIGAPESDTGNIDSGSAYASATATSIEDCNENGTIDGCEISLGFASDVNLNGVPDECECLADIDGSTTVGVPDLLAVLNNWGLCPEPCPPLCAGDVNGSCTVDVQDLLFVLTSWGPCPP